MRPKQRPRITQFFAKYGLYIGLVLLVILFGLLSERFLTPNNLMTILWQASALAIMAAGMTFIILLGDIDISVGSIVYLAGSLGVLFMKFGGPIWLGTLIIVFTGTALGFLNGWAVGKLKINPLITTLAGLNVYRGVALLLTNVSLFIVPREARTIAIGSFLGIPYPVIVAGLVFGLGHLILTRTQLGRHIYAVGCDEKSAEQTSINIAKTRISAFVIGGTCTGIAALIWVGRLGATSSSLGLGMEFTVITAVVLGGTSLSGGTGKLFPNTLIGALIVTVIENGMNLVGLNVYLYDIVRGAVVFTAVFLDVMLRRNESKKNALRSDLLVHQLSR